MWGDQILHEPLQVRQACALPDCVRCQCYQERRALSVARWRAQRSATSSARLETAMRLLALGRVTRDPLESYRPTLLHIPELRAPPLMTEESCTSCCAHMLQAARAATTALQMDYEQLLAEADSNSSSSGPSFWKHNQTDQGQWLVAMLVDQGRCNNELWAACPGAAALLRLLQSDVCRCVFGNAFFSVLDPGAKIEPHTGPANARLRLHIPLNDTPAILRCGGTQTHWRVGEPFLMDDSYEHSVEYCAPPDVRVSAWQLL
ncbi:uncharacterized protein MONBRDRAFT_36109 [Monosiga brevicollis MX1]|uniref:Aspartyl/asparaginy/proline hydroxylase domain-containing protein n=1 Tax=Monosiga brevicollis TaxID=81824 RepID=A9UT45_MONBE|nr:uncharacterized protein MONBRDRAFT_36109 [Monosiga brevicollis MX1]EDQ91431.1 predicted protein [Monosiga brevicollis MX1]|eukprot:XP_001743853.1 hypothetical protein [Monosiga brevicollis MX1]